VRVGGIARRLAFLRDVGLAAMGVATLLLMVIALRTPQPPVSAGAHDAPHLLVVSGGSLRGTVVDAVAADLGWQARAVLRDGSGMTRAARRGDDPLGPALRQAGIPRDTDVIAIQGGEFDTGAATRTVTIGTVHLVDYAIAFKPPAARLVVIGPIPKGPATAVAYGRVNDLMREVAVGRHVPFVDAIAEGWSMDDVDLSVKLAAALRRVQLTGAGTADTRTAGVGPSP
jgi:hypothetical protein